MRLTSLRNLSESGLSRNSKLMTAPGYRDDIVVSGPLTTSDYFILTNVVTFEDNYQPADVMFPSVNNIMTLGLVQGPLTTTTQPFNQLYQLYPDPDILFSTPLSAQAILGKAYNGSIAPLYVKYSNFRVVAYNNNLTTSASMTLSVYNRNKQFLGYIDQTFAYISSSPYEHTFQFEGMPSTTQLYSGVPFQLIYDRPQLGYNICGGYYRDDIIYGLCSPDFTHLYSPIDSKNTVTGQNSNYVINRLIAIPLNYYQDRGCTVKDETLPGELPDAIKYQQCTVSSVVEGYSMSLDCQAIPKYYTDSTTCQNNPDGAYVVSTQGSGTNTVCGRASQYVPYQAEINLTLRNQTTTSFGPCDSGDCLYDAVTDLFTCKIPVVNPPADNPPAGGGTNPPAGGGDNPPAGGGTNPPAGGGDNPPAGGGGDDDEEDKNKRLIILVVIAIILVILIVCVGIALFMFSKKKSDNDDDDKKADDKDNNHSDSSSNSDDNDTKDQPAKDASS